MNYSGLIKSTRPQQAVREREGASEPLCNLSFDAPIRIHSEANNRDHWATKSKRRKAQQQEMDAMLLNALRGRKVALPCTVKLTRVGPKKMDDDNWINGAKGIRDAIARRLGIDDGDPRIKFEYEQRPIGERSYNVLVEITSVYLSAETMTI